MDVLFVMMSSDIVTAYDDAEHCNEVTFSPPLYRQRYDLATSILQEAKVTSVCFDCSSIKVKMQSSFFLCLSSFWVSVNAEAGMTVHSQH